MDFFLYSFGIRKYPTGAHLWVRTWRTYQYVRTPTQVKFMIIYTNKLFVMVSSSKPRSQKKDSLSLDRTKRGLSSWILLTAWRSCARWYDKQNTDQQLPHRRPRSRSARGQSLQQIGPIKHADLASSRKNVFLEVNFFLSICWGILKWNGVFVRWKPFKIIN